VDKKTIHKNTTWSEQTRLTRLTLLVHKVIFMFMLLLLLLPVMLSMLGYEYMLSDIKL
jgi:hypothetical protein